MKVIGEGDCGKGHGGYTHKRPTGNKGNITVMGYIVRFFKFFLNFGMFYQFLCVPHHRSSTQSWGSVLPSIVEKRDQNSQGCPLLFSNSNLGSFCA